MYESLRRLTEALQDLERNRREGYKPIELPREIPVSDLLLSDGVAKFIEIYHNYFEKLEM